MSIEEILEAMDIELDKSKSVPLTRNPLLTLNSSEILSDR